MAILDAAIFDVAVRFLTIDATKFICNVHQCESH